MPIKLTAPDYEDFLIASPSGTWIPSSRWDPLDHESFLKMRKSSMSSLDKCPKILHDKKRPEPFLAAQWLLKDSAEAAAGWAELQAFPRKHFRYGILLAGMPESDRERARIEFGFLLSYVFLLGKFDNVRVIPTAQSDNLYSGLREWAGEEKTIIGLPLMPILQRSWVITPVLDISRVAWTGSKASQPSLRSLNYVSLRLDRYEKMGGKKKQKKRNLLARLFRPRIEDSLF